MKDVPRNIGPSFCHMALHIVYYVQMCIMMFCYHGESMITTMNESHVLTIH
jgi:hypothetical protein